jgi:peptidoglycan/xylan/chitin deacetylase (PgdA/CDA1 family)
VTTPLATMPAARAATNTVVSIEFDDGYSSQYQTRAMLSAHGMRATYYIISGDHGMSWSQIHDLANDGNEIGGHTISHPDLTSLSTAAATTEVCGGRDQLIAQGFSNVVSFAYPYGRNNASVQQVVQSCGYTSGRDVTGNTETIPPQNPFRTRTPENVNEDMPLSEVQGFVTQAENNGGGWVQLVFHDICSPGGSCDHYSMPPATFNALLDWLQSRAANGTVVKTVGEVMGTPTPPPPPPPSGPYAPGVVADAPAGYWRLNDTGTTAADSAGTNTGTFTGATRGAAGLLTAEPANKAAGFSGTGQYVQIPSATALSPTARVSVEAWMKPTTLPATGAFRSIASKAESYSLQFNGPRLEFTLVQGATRRRLQAPAGAIVAGATYHVVGTYDGTTQRLYVNGAQVASVALTGAIGANTNSLIVGSWNGAQEFFAGTIDEVAVYPAALTAARVSAHYQAGSGGAPSPPSTSKLTVSKAGAGTGTVTSSPSGINCGTTCSASFNNGTNVTLSAAAASGSTFTGWSGGGCSGTATCVVALAANTAVTATFATTAPPPPSGYAQTVVADTPVGYWRLDETAGTTAANSVATSGAGTYQGVTLGTAGLLANAADKAVTFPGGSSRVQVASNTALSPTARVTVEAWIKASALPASGAFGSIVSKAESYSLQFNGPRLEFTIIQGGARRRLQAAPGAIVVGSVYHVVGTYDGTTQRLYVNGVQVASVALTGAITANTNSVYIGSWNGTSEFFQGVVDEVAVYGTALTATQITNHRTAGLT